MNPGLVGGIAGCVIGAIGGIIGTWATLRSTRGPRERAFAVKVSIVVWIAAIVFLALLLLLPMPWRFFLSVPYGVLLPVGITTCNRTQQRIREEESRDAATGESGKRPPSTLDPQRLRHSEIGIASIVVGLIGTCQLAAYVHELNLPPPAFGHPFEFDAGPWMSGTAYCIATCLVGIVVAAVGMRQSNRDRTTCVAGFILNALVMMGTLGLLLSDS